MIRQNALLITLLLFALASTWAIADPVEDEAEEQRRVLEALRNKHPERLEKLRKSYQAFSALSDQRKAALVKLDQELEKLTGKKKERHWGALVRYADWLEELRKKDPDAYQKIKQAPDAATRLALIKDRREHEWMETQPKKYREEWEKLKGEARAEFLSKLREEEREKHQQWLIAKQFWDKLEAGVPLPARLADFAHKDLTSKKKEEVNRVKEYVTEYLLPNLTPKQKQELQEAEGRWPDYPRKLVELARKRPSALPVKGDGVKLPTQLSELPKPIQLRVSLKGKKKMLLPELQNWEHREEFASKVVEFGSRKGSQPFEYEFWASNQSSLKAPMQAFVKETLKPKLNADETKQLLNSEGFWPDYPEKIQELSRKYGLQPPWHYLPEPELWRWDVYRSTRAKSWDPEPTKEKDAPKSNE